MTSQMNPRTAATNGRLWGARARDWADLQEGMVRPVYEAVLRRTRIKAGSHYLDVGCGTGMAAQMASALGARAVGIDASEALLTIARERTPSGHFRIGDLEALPLTDQSFDVVTGFNSFQYAGNPGVALAEARRVAKPDAQVVVVTWGSQTPCRLHRWWPLSGRCCRRHNPARRGPSHSPTRLPCASLPRMPGFARSRSSMWPAPSIIPISTSRSGHSIPPLLRYAQQRIRVKRR